MGCGPSRKEEKPAPLPEAAAAPTKPAPPATAPTPPPPAPAAPPPPPLSKTEADGKSSSLKMAGSALPLSDKKFTVKKQAVLGRESEDFFSLYTLGKELGKGQFGTVHECFFKADGSRWAAKLISKTKLKTPEETEDVRREVQIMHHLVGHENIVCLKGAYEDARCIYLVMEVCEGGELFARIVAAGHYSEAKAADVFRVMLRVVHHCHSLGVAHRDLKPENFLLSAKGDVGVLKATDFGLSVFFKKGEVLDEFVGSPYYVAPEVLKRKYGPECDIWSAGVILFILLGGLPPFWGENEKAIFDAVLKGDLDFDEDPWPKISASAKDLVKKLLVKDVSKRMSIKEALEHPWLAKGGASDEPLDVEVMNRLRTFANNSKFKKAGMVMLVKHLKKEELEGLRQIFIEFDTDKSGTITMDELKKGLEQSGAKLAGQEVAKLMEGLDLDGDHELSYEEFMAATVHMHKLESEDNLLQAFHDFDTDHSGSISPEELASKLVELNISNSKEEVLAMINEVDTDHDGSIDYNEFVALMCPRLLGHKAEDVTTQNRNFKLRST